MTAVVASEFDGLICPGRNIESMKSFWFYTQSLCLKFIEKESNLLGAE